MGPGWVKATPASAWRQLISPEFLPPFTGLLNGVWLFLNKCSWAPTAVPYPWPPSPLSRGLQPAGRDVLRQSEAQAKPESGLVYGPRVPAGRLGAGQGKLDRQAGSESRHCSIGVLWRDGSGWTPYPKCHPPPIIPPLKLQSLGF